MANPQLDIDVVEALLAAMHTGGNGGSDMYDDDEDDDDYDDEEDDENEDDDSYYDGETIETLINSYGGAGGDIANMGDVADGGMPAHTMNLLQGLLSMNAPNMAAELEAALGSGGSGGMASLGGAMEGAAAAAAAFLPNMQIPNMGSDMQGAIVGAAMSAGSAMIEGYQQAGYGQYDDDDDDDEDDDDDSILTSEEDDDDDDEESLRGHPHLGMEAAMLGGMGGAMAGGMLANVAGNFIHRSSYTEAIRHLPSPHASEQYRHSPHVSETYKQLPPPHVQNASLPSIMSQAAFAAAAAVAGAAVGSAATAMSGHSNDSRLALPQSHKTFVPPNGAGSMQMLLASPNSRPNQAALPPIPPNQSPMNSGQMPSALSPYTSRPMPPSSTPALGFCLPNQQPSSAVQPMPIAPSVSIPLPSSQPSYTCVSTTSIGTMSGGSVSRTDPLALLMNGASGAALGGMFQANVSNLLGKSGGTTIVNNKAISASRIHTSLPSPIGNAKASDNMTSVTVKLAATTLECSSRNLKQLMPPPSAPATIPSVKNAAPMGATKKVDTVAPLPLTLKKECDDDKTSVSSSGSEGSGGGKSDTESVGKKTPSPPPESDEATCGSIPDLTSATESMRDSDTDNHSEAHNMTANLSDVDSDVHEQQQQQYQQQMQQLLYQQQQQKAYTPFLIERPSTSWSNMEGVDNAKDALKNLFTAKDFPAVFEGTEGSCRGVLLFGPPFSGKTHLARSLPKEVNANVFVAVNFQELFSNSYVMQTDFAKVISLMFENARRERPAVILFDQIEHLCQQHPIVKCAKDELLAQVRGQSLLHQKRDPNANDGIFVIATTNKPGMLQDDILRSIFAYNIHVKLPDEKARHNILGMSLQKLPHNINEEQLQCLVSKSEGYSMIDMNTVVKKALMKKNPSFPMNTNALLTIDDVTTEMTNYVCPYTDELRESYVSYISAATHKATKGGDKTDEASKDKKDKPKKKKISHRIAKSLAAVVLAVID